MVLGGLQKSSLIDYPGKISCVLFLSGCNFDCPYCHNPDLAKNNIHTLLNEDSVYDFLEMRKDFLDGVVISGGEPTLQKDLTSLCEKTKQMGYPVKIDTNGSRPHVIKKLIDEGLVDYIAMDIKTDPLNYSPLIQKKSNPDNIVSSIRIIMESNIDYEFRTTCIKPLVDARIVEDISRFISGSMLYALQKFNNTRVLHPEFFQTSECGYNDDDLIHFQAIAKPWVKKCIVR
ncbi:MAG: pyruvate formate lyase activating enzyme [Desulfobacteraceae bacterium Eth-SRB1]|nr:MAG: pyruvate formate lyase activating enzyme [Desulfobacteraceae bacterium Eth-SRB1]